MRGKTIFSSRPAMALSALALGVSLLFSQTGCQSTSDEPMSIGAQVSEDGSSTVETETSQGRETNRYPNPLAVNFGGRSANLQSPPPKITARAAILVDGSGRVLFEKNADSRMPVASTQKLLLGIMIAERGGLNEIITIQDPDTWAEPTKMGIKTGQTYTRSELLRAVLVRSSNDIARALARDHSGSVSNFAANMNRRARSLGMNNSYFTNASGLPTPAGQYSTARDLSKLGKAALRNPTVRDAVRTKGMVFRFSDGRTTSISNTNLVLRNFPYCTGAKTGFTNAAGRCLVSSGSANGRNVVAVILGSTSPTVWKESEALLRYGLGM
ncbi:MAG: D-alanyl-D-alanine carboxypeptidase [Verrucomicrobiales bacterium]|nr:D-alanyl-D-alanine carboxypeptidase [Verrucomicrobiales bacterium]